MTRFLSATVMLGVEHPPTSAEWWRRAGFDVAATDAEFQDGQTYNWARLERGEAALMLTLGSREAAESAPVQLFFSVTDADAVFGELCSEFGEDLRVLEEPTDRHYGMRDFWIRNEDGFELGFGHPIGA